MRLLLSFSFFRKNQRKQTTLFFNRILSFAKLQFLRNSFYLFVVFVYLKSLIYVIYNMKREKKKTRLLFLYDLIAIVKLK